MREGDYYRIASFRENGVYDCWMSTSKDKKEALVTFVQVLAKPNQKSFYIRLQGLDPNAEYCLEGTEQVYSGSLLMYAGILIPQEMGDFKSRLLHFTAGQRR